MVSGSNEHRSRGHGEENQDLCLVNVVVEGRHQRKQPHSQERVKEKMELGGAAPARPELQKLIRQSKRKMCGDYLQNRRGVEVWRAAQYANPRPGMTLDTLTDRDAKQSNRSLENEEMLRHQSFPTNDDDQYYELPPTGSPHTHVTEKPLERAIISQSLKKAPGPDKLSFGAIRLLWEWDKESIVRVATAANRPGRH
jgi:hypothetical protein